jgi:C-terminal processing protease CtpA/Prc
MNRKISVGMAVTIVILAMTVTFSITMLIAMRLFDSTVSSVKEKESMYNKVAEVDRYVRSNDYYTIDETMLYDRLTAGYLLGTGDKYARYYTANAYTELMNQQSGKVMGIGVELGMDQNNSVIKFHPANQVQSCKDHPHDGGTDGRAAGNAGQLLFGFRLQFHKGKPPVKFTDAN